MKTIRVADYTRSPGGRFVSDGPYSGEWFRDEVIKPQLQMALHDHDRLEVLLDGTSGYGSSFLEECFGGLVRKRVFDPEVIQQNLVITARNKIFAPYKRLADRFIRDAQPDAVAA